MDLVTKITMLVLGAYCVHKAAKPPNPPAAPEEQEKFFVNRGLWDKLTIWLATKEPALFRYTTYCITLCEILAILSSLLLHTAITPRVFHVPSSISIHTLSPTTSFYAGVLCMCTGALIRAACYRHLGRFFTFDLAVKKDHHLVTSGPYAVVRHPSYVGACLFYLGCCLAQLGPGSWLAEGGLWGTTVGRIVAAVYVGRTAAVCLWLVSRVQREDMVLSREFGPKWVAWTKQTPYRLVPFVY